MKKLLLIGMAALLVLAGCESKEQKAAKAAAKASAELLDAMTRNDAAKLEEVLSGLAPEILASLSSGTSASPGGDFAYDLNEAGDGIVIKKYTGNGGVLVIPATIEGYPVVELPSFQGNYDITSVVIPPGVKIIPGLTFKECENLTTVILPDTVEEIGWGAFYKCVSLHTVNLPARLKSVNSSVYNGAFGNCGELYTVTIPDSLTAVSWGPYEFKGCGKLPLKTRQRLKDLGYTGEF
jgi:hypothetical protein